MKFLFFTKTKWNEPPRLRRQLAELLLKNGHSVIFMEKPRFLFPQRNRKISVSFTLQAHPYLIHHQLRVNSILRQLNSLYEMVFVRKLRQCIDEDTIIVNFNYDAVYLRKIFKRNKIITVINDDFISQAKFFNGSHVSKSLRITCDQSNHVLAVSRFLVESIRTTTNVNLFLPWSKSSYQRPTSPAANRDMILIWGYVDQRVDLSFLQEVIAKNPNYKFIVAGPIDKKILKNLTNMQLHFPNLSLVGVQDLSDLPVSSMLCALVPYKIDTSFGRSVTMLNKGFPLLSAGLPLIIRGMPNFLASKSIFDVSGSSGVKLILEHIVLNYEDIQDEARDLISQNCEEERYKEFLSFT